MTLYYSNAKYRVYLLPIVFSSLIFQLDPSFHYLQLMDYGFIESTNRVTHRSIKYYYFLYDRSVEVTVAAVVYGS